MSVLLTGLGTVMVLSGTGLFLVGKVLYRFAGVYRKYGKH